MCEFQQQTKEHLEALNKSLTDGEIVMGPLSGGPMSHVAF